MRDEFHTDKVFLEAYKGLVPPTQFDEETKMHREIIAALSATIPRKTSECAPAEADADKKCDAVLTKSQGRWMQVYWKNVRDNPEIYVEWMPIPAMMKGDGE